LPALLSPLRIRREESLCIDCAKCAKTCPSRLPVDKLVTIKSAECTACMECVAVCPAQGALEMVAVRNRRVPVWAMAAGMAVVFLGVVAYAQWAGGDLPTEAQWEMASRGTENRAYPWGNSWVDGYCNLWQNTPPPVSVLAVGSKANDISQYGVMDLGGNVAEWCKEHFGQYPNSTVLVTDPDGSANQNIDPHMFAVRGGAWTNVNGTLSTSGRCAERSAGGDGTQQGSNGYNPGIGFRCAVQ
jgi:formylglycine-generating enzyme required for sulfatase activity